MDFVTWIIFRVSEVLCGPLSIAFSLSSETDSAPLDLTNPQS